MKHKITKIIIFILVIGISFFYTIKWLSKREISLDNYTIELLLESSNNLEPKNRLINTIVTAIKESDKLNPVSYVIKDYDERDSNEEIIEVVSTKIEEKNQNPIIYIYNTHQGEKYSSPKEININYSVMDASLNLQQKLKKYNIDSFVETLSVQDVLNTNNWNYASSYRVTKSFMEQRKKENPYFMYYIDLHRDSVNKNISTVEINGIKYAKTLFLLGLENPNYKENEKEIEKLDKWLNDNYKGLSRGIYKKKGRGVNGVYNQDFSKFCFLIEVGGEENTYEEVDNTLNVIALMLNNYIGGKLD